MVLTIIMDFRKDLANIYENHILNNSEEDFEEDIIKESSDRFTLEDYTTLIDEGSHGDRKIIMKILDQGIREGLIKDFKATADGYMLYSAVDNTQFTTHHGEKNFHYIRRYLEKLRKIAGVSLKTR